MQLINKVTGDIIAEIMTNRSMTIDEALMLMHYTTGPDGQIMDEDTGAELPAYYDDLEMIY